ncbi:MAG: CusA/CzcA family heavy metal efflux RND transporter [Candidatus Gracilibacteria bacterium]|nr:CusA/CzcA family heavy metal efflux RND transporter [Candidatus Gracilibacteria bacterium]
MIKQWISAAIQNRFLTFLLCGALVGGSFLALRQTPVDAIPDLSENQVIVMTSWPGQSPQNIENQITYPITVGMQGLPDVRAVRSSSMLGVSMVTVIFKDSTDLYFARDRVAERLAIIRNQLPPGVMPMLGPDATGIGHIFMYTLESEEKSLTELRSIQDFQVRYALQGLPGVAEVASVGGYLRTYQIVLDPLKLDQHQISVSTVVEKIKMANNNVSGNVLEYGQREIAVQGLGFFESPQEIEYLVLGKQADGMPLLVSDLGTVRTGGAPRRGILADAEGEKVGGIVVMRYGQNPLAVIESVKASIQKLPLPDDVKIVPFYDRTELIQNSIRTLRDVLLQMLAITAVVLWFFLLNGRATFLTVGALIFGVLLTFLWMWVFKIPSNIMSLGGIAIAIGTMVDSAIVVTENAYQRLRKTTEHTIAARFQAVKAATLEVGPPLVFAILIICFSFLPIFALEGMEGKLFRPLAFTNIFAMLSALIAAIFFIPAFCVHFLKGPFKSDKQIPLVRFFQRHYRPLLRQCLQKPKRVFLILGGLVALTAVGASQIGNEFMPPLDEGTIMYMPMTVPDVSERQARDLLIETNKIFAQMPEVESVVGKAGRADTATDPAPLAMIETFITLKPKSEWRPGMTKEKLIQEMSRKAQFPNLWNGFTQPIIGRIDMVSTGIRSEVGIKIFGEDSAQLESLAIEVERLMLSIPGATGVVAIRTSGLKYLDIELDEEALALHGIPKHELLHVIDVGIGGKTIGETIQGREQYDIAVRFQRPFREDIADISSFPIQTAAGTMVPLSAVADVTVHDGPAVLHSEDGRLRGTVQMDVSGRDLGGFIGEARRHLKTNLELPEGYVLEFDGQYKNQIRASQKLSWVVPAVIAVIFLILYLAYKDLGLVSIVMLAIPLSLIGGIAALWLAQYNFSVAVWVGFIALFGNAVETGVVIVLYLENALKEKLKTAHILTKSLVHEAILEGATRRLRPILMTGFTSILGLLPMLITTGTGAELQKPLAVVVVGGLITSITATLLVIPILFDWIRSRRILS